MRIAVLCGAADHPVFPQLTAWCGRQRQAGHEVSLATDPCALPAAGEILFLVSYGRLVGPAIRHRFNKTLILHASDLPKGRGWSPHAWEILSGASRLTVSLIEAAEPVDSGPVWTKRHIDLDGTELYDEINAKLFSTELSLMDHALQIFGTVTPEPQNQTTQSTWYRRRTPADSELDPHRSLAEQFDLLRVCDPQRFPAFFRLRGATYRLTIEKISDARNDNRN